MSWWGKLLGGAFGYVLGGPLGALIGVALGHNIEARMGSITSSPDVRERTQTAFFTATFSVLGHLAKSDGRVTRDEIRLTEMVMDQMRLGPELRELARNLFRQGKETGFALEAVIQQLKQECHHSRMLLRMFIEILLQAAYADGNLHPAEKAILLHICARLGLSHAEFEHLDTLVRGSFNHERRSGAEAGRIAHAYKILGISPDASNEEVKKAYRRLLNQHHPDKLVAKGLPEEMLRLASQKTHEIRTAYEQIRSQRGF